MKSAGFFGTLCGSVYQGALNGIYHVGSGAHQDASRCIKFLHSWVAFLVGLVPLRNEAISEPQLFPSMAVGKRAKFRRAVFFGYARSTCELFLYFFKRAPLLNSCCQWKLAKHAHCRLQRRSRLFSTLSRSPFRTVTRRRLSRYTHV